MKTIIPHDTSKFHYFRIREDYLLICENNPTAAAILDLFEYWTVCRQQTHNDIQKENQIRSIANEPGKDVPGLWLRETAQDVTDGLLGAWSINTVRKSLKWLCESEYLLTRNTKIFRDRAKEYNLNQGLIVQKIEALSTKSGIAESPNLATEQATNLVDELPNLVDDPYISKSLYKSHLEIEGTNLDSGKNQEGDNSFLGLPKLLVPGSGDSKSSDRLPTKCDVTDKKIAPPSRSRYDFGLAGHEMNNLYDLQFTDPEAKRMMDKPQEFPEFVTWFCDKLNKTKYYQENGAASNAKAQLSFYKRQPQEKYLIVLEYREHLEAKAKEEAELAKYLPDPSTGGMTYEEIYGAPTIKAPPKKMRSGIGHNERAQKIRKLGEMLNQQQAEENAKREQA